MSDAEIADSREGVPEPPLTTPSRLRLTRWVLYATGMLVLAAIIGLFTGTLGELGFWRIVGGACLVFVYVSAFQVSRMHREFLWLMDILDRQQHLIAGITAVPTVRCAGCRAAASLAGQPAGVTDAGEPGVRLPPGWDMRNGRPYCPRCLDEVTAL